MVGWVEAAVESGNEALYKKLPTMRTSNLQSDPEISKQKQTLIYINFIV
jgi:hypothetical protein